MKCWWLVGWVGGGAVVAEAVVVVVVLVVVVGVMGVVEDGGS